MVSLNSDFPVPVLAEPQIASASVTTHGKTTRGEARESTNLTFTDGVALPDVKSDSRGGENNLGEAAHGATPVADTDAAPAQKKRKGRGIRFESGRAKCGHVDRGEKILSDFEVDVAMRIFWEKRGYKKPPVEKISWSRDLIDAC